MNIKMMWLYVTLFILLLTVTGCAGPVAAPTQPPVIPTDTPVPINLTIQVNNPDGKPVSNANSEVGGETKKTDTNGSAVFNNLGKTSASLKISASGYTTSTSEQSLKPGDNKVTLTLDLDPAGLLEENACAAGEKMVYMEDFQDGEAQGWDQEEVKSAGWSVEADPKNSANKVYAAKEGARWTWLGGRDTYKFQNVVWRLLFRHSGGGNSHLNFRFVESSEKTFRYFLAAGDNSQLNRLDKTGNHLGLGETGAMKRDEWHLIEMGYYNGEVSVYIDGKKGMVWKDPNPWEGGTINLEPNPQNGGVMYYDNLSVCELSASFQPIPRAKTGINLSLTLKDEKGTPITGASASVAELGNSDEASKTVDESGKVSWNDLPGPAVSLQISAPGYQAKQETLTIKKGDNQSDYTLKRDPFGKPVSEVCRSNEKLLYSEDIQDKTLQGWTNLMNKINMGAPGWSIIDEPGNPGNIVLKVERVGEANHVDSVRYEGRKFSDAVVRFSAKAFSAVHYIIGWPVDNSVVMKDQTFDFAGYVAFIYADKATGGRVEKVIENAGARTGAQVISWSKNLQDGKWHNFEIVFNKGEYQMWIDTKLVGKWLDPNPLSGGYFQIENDLRKADGTAMYDNFAVCGLSEAFKPMLTPTPAKK